MYDSFGEVSSEQENQLTYKTLTTIMIKLNTTAIQKVFIFTVD